MRQMQRKAAIFCHLGLGDGIISLVISNNFHQNGWEVDTFHPLVGELQNWFPHLPVKPYPSKEAILEILSVYDRIIVFHNHTYEFVQDLIEKGKKMCPEKVRVIYPYPSRNLPKELYYKDSYINPEISIVENLQNFCAKSLYLSNVTKGNGFMPPMELIHRKNALRVCIHPKSSRGGKNWPKNKYVKLALHLRKGGFTPVFILHKDEEKDWKLELEKYGFFVPQFSSLDALGRFIYESRYFIGNDSGIGHLASSLGIFTITICRRKMVAKFWRPGWAPGKIVCPSQFIPNIKGFRMRDIYWKKCISVKKVLRSFEVLFQQTSN